ncbi:MAG: hypothetical protein PHN82_07810 [bacterium]|nr:hypothetical protein [bacterium]
MIALFTESMVEEAALSWLEAIGWRIAHGPDIAFDMLTAERHDYGEVALAQRLRDALVLVNVKRRVIGIIGHRVTQLPAWCGAETLEATA